MKLKLLDIQRALTKLIGDVEEFKDFDIISGSNNGFSDIDTPTFIVNVRGVGTNNYVDYKHKVVNITLYYINKEYNHVECMDIQDKLEDVFGITLKVNGRHLAVENLDFNEQDFLQCDFTLKFNNLVERKSYPKMGNLDLNLK